MLTAQYHLGQFVDPNAVVEQLDLDVLKGFEKYLNELLKEPILDPSGKEAPFVRYKYILVDDDVSTTGYGWNYAYPFATVAGGTWNAIVNAASKGGCIYDYGHYILPGRTKPESGGGSSPFLLTDVWGFQGSELFKDIPEKMFLELPNMFPRHYIGRPHEVLVSTQQAIKCLQERMAAQAEGEEVEEGRPAPAADYLIRRQGLPGWFWWTVAGLTTVVGSVAVLLWRRRERS